MSEKPTQSAGAESPTTARELDFDDEPHDGGLRTGTTTAAPVTASSEALRPSEADEAPPPQPPRAISPQQQAEITLREAFPSIDAAVVKAVLTASGGRVEPAFNALLGMSDPDAQREPTPPPPPPRPAQVPQSYQTATTTPHTQLAADEQYARQLAEHYSGTSRMARDPPPPKPRRETGLKPSELYDDNHSFLDDDLPVIKENFRKGFLETQNKFNRWVSDLKKKIEGPEEDENGTYTEPHGSQAAYQPQATRRSGDLNRRSADHDRYDADPRVLGDDFTGLELRDDEGSARRSTRPLANPDLFKPTPATPQSGSRKVSFQDGPPADIDVELSRGSPKPPNQSSATKQSKWEPLSAVDPNPIADNDPFSLGDSDDERDSKTKDLKSEDTERLKQAAAEAMADDIGPNPKKTLEAEEHSGTKDKAAEELLTGKK